MIIFIYGEGKERERERNGIRSPLHHHAMLRYVHLYLFPSQVLIIRFENQRFVCFFYPDSESLSLTPFPTIF